jgi:ATP-dependent exoDNAse (exonuclease V) alpha subunit
MIARDNATREQLNHAARQHLKTHRLLPVDGELIGDREWAPGDRVIARRNNPALDIDNGTTASITAIARNGQHVLITTDAGRTLVLDRAYVHEHLQHAYATTAHSSQGATVRDAIIVGRPEDFTREWAYTALSRAQGHTTIHLFADRGPAPLHSPPPAQATATPDRPRRP